MEPIKARGTGTQKGLTCLELESGRIRGRRRIRIGNGFRRMDENR